MKLSNEEIAHRKPLWTAFSNLFLDTELDDSDLSGIARCMKESDYSLSELERILKEEVFPVCNDNLLSVAGEWTGFDEEWLQNRILSAQAPNRFQRTTNKLKFAMIRKDWERILTFYSSPKE